MRAAGRTTTVARPRASPSCRAPPATGLCRSRWRSSRPDGSGPRARVAENSCVACEVFEARARAGVECFTVRRGQSQAFAGGYSPDHGRWCIACGKGLFDGERGCRRRGEAQLVIVTAGKLYAPARLFVGKMFGQRARRGQAAEVELGADAAALQDMPQVGEQAVAQVDRRSGKVAQRDACSDARRRAVEAITKFRGHQALPLPLQQGAGGIAQRTGDPDVVVESGAVAAQRDAGRREAMRTDGEDRKSTR